MAPERGGELSSRTQNPISRHGLTTLLCSWPESTIPSVEKIMSSIKKMKPSGLGSGQISEKVEVNCSVIQARNDYVVLVLEEIKEKTAWVVMNADGHSRN
ncbi:hypothetical protein Cni_G29247 [Canna indica]|uniref:Uncharacterized protein n=1 Tax=Canna indica TaxID=4628 RepID=A0AAQ3L3Z8_9LILI|nr:hypothetical protein Cni_G29247 [Canna indica]